MVVTKRFGQPVRLHLTSGCLAYGDNALLDKITRVMVSNFDVLRTLGASDGCGEIDCSLVVHVERDSGLWG